MICFFRSTRFRVLWLAIACFSFQLLPVFGQGPQGPSSAQSHAKRGLELLQSGELKEAEAELRRAVEQAPGNVQYLASLASLLIREQKLEEATAFLERALKLDPHNLDLRRSLAVEQWELGRLEAARDNLERILQAKPRDELAILVLGMVYENLQDYARAAKLLGAVEPLVRQRPESIAALARSYYQTGQKDKARDLLDSLRSHPAGPQGVFLGGQIATEAADYETAEGLFTSIKSTFPDAATLGYNLALVQYRSNRFDVSQKTLLDLIGTGYKEGEIYNLLALCYYKQNMMKEAVGAFEKAIELEPSKESNYLDLDQVLFEQKQYNAARAVAMELVARNPQSSRGYQLKGLVERQFYEYTDAVESYGRAIQLDPTLPEANLGLALAQWGAGMLQEAERTFENGTRRFPRDALNYQEYGRFLLKRVDTGDRTADTRAAALLKKAMDLNGSLPEPHFLLGDLLLTKGKINEALPQLEEAAQLDPNVSRYRFALSRAYRRAGRPEEASRELEAFRRLKADEDKLGAASSVVQSGRN